MELCGGSITPEIIGNLTDAEIQKCGMSHRKAGYVKAAAKAILSGELDLTKIVDLDDDSAIKALTHLPGVGVWTAEMLLIFSLQRRNVFSFGDLAIKRGLCRIHGHKEVSRELFEKYRRRYTPYGSIACIYLWHVSGETA